jgi:broad specificity phosphatase PhoE
MSPSIHRPCLSPCLALVQKPIPRILNFNKPLLMSRISNSPKRIHLIRHAQAIHKFRPDLEPANVGSTTYDYTIPDPPLTPLGETQSLSIPKKYPSLFFSDPLLVSSPLRRTLQTSLMGFKRAPIPHPGFQENSAKPCDTGSPPSILRKQFPQLDFGLVREGWDSKKGEYAADEATLAVRAGRMREWLKDREENEIIVVTHGGIHHVRDLLTISISDVFGARDSGV